MTAPTDALLIEKLRMLQSYGGATGREKANARQAADRIEALLATIEAAKELGEAARTFLAKYDECEPSLTSMAVFQQMHLGPYNGPSFGEELAALRTAAQWQGREGEG